MFLIKESCTCKWSPLFSLATVSTAYSVLGAASSQTNRWEGKNIATKLVSWLSYQSGKWYQSSKLTKESTTTQAMANNSAVVSLSQPSIPFFQRHKLWILEHKVEDYLDLEIHGNRKRKVMLKLRFPPKISRISLRGIPSLSLPLFFFF